MTPEEEAAAKKAAEEAAKAAGPGGGASAPPPAIPPSAAPPASPAPQGNPGAPAGGTSEDVLKIERAARLATPGTGFLGFIGQSGKSAIIPVHIASKRYPYALERSAVVQSIYGGMAVESLEFTPNPTNMQALASGYAATRLLTIEPAKADLFYSTMPMDGVRKLQKEIPLYTKAVEGKFWMKLRRADITMGKPNFIKPQHFEDLGLAKAEDITKMLEAAGYSIEKDSWELVKASIIGMGQDKIIPMFCIWPGVHRMLIPPLYLELIDIICQFIDMMQQGSQYYRKWLTELKANIKSQIINQPVADLMTSDAFQLLLDIQDMLARLPTMAYYVALLAYTAYARLGKWEGIFGSKELPIKMEYPSIPAFSEVVAALGFEGDIKDVMCAGLQADNFIEPVTGALDTHPLLLQTAQMQLQILKKRMDIVLPKIPSLSLVFNDLPLDTNLQVIDLLFARMEALRELFGLLPDLSSYTETYVFNTCDYAVANGFSRYTLWPAFHKVHYTLLDYRNNIMPMLDEDPKEAVGQVDLKAIAREGPSREAYQHFSLAGVTKVGDYTVIFPHAVVNKLPSGMYNHLISGIEGDKRRLEPSEITVYTNMDYRQHGLLHIGIRPVTMDMYNKLEMILSLETNRSYGPMFLKLQGIQNGEVSWKKGEALSMADLITDIGLCMIFPLSENAIAGLPVAKGIVFAPQVFLREAGMNGTFFKTEGPVLIPKESIWDAVSIPQERRITHGMHTAGAPDPDSVIKEITLPWLGK